MSPRFIPRISEVISILSFEDFGEVDNPIWHIGLQIEKIHPDQLRSDFVIKLEGHVLVPIEMVTENILHRLKMLDCVARRKIMLQAGLAQFSRLEAFLKNEFPCQIWLDRNLTDEDLQNFAKLEQAVEVVLVPFRQLELTQIVKVLSVFEWVHVLLLMVYKTSPFDGLRKLHELYPIAYDLSATLAPKSLGQVTPSSWQTTLPSFLQNYLLHPTAENFEKALEHESAFQAWLFRKTLHAPVSGADIFEYIFKSIRTPQYFYVTTKNFFQYTVWHHMKYTAWHFIRHTLWHYTSHTIWPFTQNVLLYPVFKIYWFAKFQYEKRVLKSRR